MLTRRRPSIFTRIRRAWRELVPPPMGTTATPIYGGAQMGRLFADWITGLLHPDEELKWNLRTLRARARDLDRNNGLAHQFLNLLEINVIGPSGLTLAAQVRDPSGKLAQPINSQIEDAWFRWSSGPVTLDETLDLVGLQQLLVRTVPMDGEAFVRIRRGLDTPFGIALEPIDADQVDDTLNRERRGEENEIRLGVEIDTLGRRVAYHVSDRPISLAGSHRLMRVPAADIIPLYLPRRVNQTRGVTWFAPAMWAMKQEAGYTEAELVGARIGASKMGFFEQAAGEFGAAPEEDSGSEGGFRTEVEPGMFSKLPAGFKFSPFDPQHPTTAYGEFTKTIIRRIASALGVSYEALSNDRASSSYSSARTGLLLERDVMRRLHAWWAFAFLRRVYSEWLNSALLKDALKLGSRDVNRFLAAKWQPRGWDWVDPLNDVQAAALAIQHGLASRKQYAAARGYDVEEIFEELAAENELAQEKGITLASSASLAGSTNSNQQAADGTTDTATDGTTTDTPQPRSAVLAALGNGHRARARAGG